MTDLVNRAKQVLSPVQGHYTELEISSGKGSYLYTKNGDSYLDFASGVAVCSTGHAHPKVVKAIQDQAATLIHACTGVVYYEENIALAEKIAPLLGNNLSSFFFCQSGTEAIEAAIKCAKYVSKKPGILAFKGGFHGRSLGALSVTSSKDKYREGYAPLLDHIHFADYPYFYHFGDGDTEEEQIKNYCDTLTQYFNELDSKTIAAAIIEPVLGEGGYVPAPAKVLDHIAALCKAHDILIIADEIQTGFGRTGKWFAFQHSTMTPDIVTLAKGMASGLPLGACVASPELMEKWTTGAHGSTFGGNPVSCAAALATIDVISEQLPHIDALSNAVRATLDSELNTHPRIGEIRHLGYMFALECISDKQSKTPDPEFCKRILTECLEQKLIIISCGIHDNVIRLIPALTASEAELNEGISRLISVLKAHQ